MTTIADAAALLEMLAPSRLAADWDNSGWQVKLDDGDLSGVILSVDATPEVVEEARAAGVNLLVTHHPLFFRGPRRLDAASLVGRTALTAVRAGVSILALHTNLDSASNGTSWALAATFGLEGGKVLEPGPEPGTGFGVVADAPGARTLAEWADLAGQRLSSRPLAVCGDMAVRHQRLAVMGGSGGGQRDRAAAAGATLYATADVRYHEAQEAVGVGLSLLVLDHYASERPVLDHVAAFLQGHLECSVQISTRRTSPWEVPAP